ncbi:Ada metal-binding domain-containing protein [Verrucomicrobium sp. GAS474]|uniref:bifunctional transcriptional activator/DNA repair enzyme AdaA n=1 Tax=Verrucomicrobium sp. GAS474 TaxID=1882831 RepID=UPI00138FF5EC|nr:Ada metal-binding domain-containing protein [Verrucomicrobium sp. GAS474]
MKGPPPHSRKNPYATDAARWAAVVGKERAADGLFWFSVATTGIYCRPSCASRPALRRNVAFHASPGAAEAAGFRPCKRCRPAAGEPSLVALRADAVTRSCRRIEAALRAGTTPPRLADLAREVGLSPHHFHRLFKSALGLTPKDYAAASRDRRLRQALSPAGTDATTTTVTEALHAAGFNAASRFYAAAPRALGMSPARFRDGGSGMRIGFAHAATPFGPFLAARVEAARGLCFASLGTSPAAIERALRAAFPRAARIAADGAFGKIVARAVSLVSLEADATPSRSLFAALPPDLQATAFQCRVGEIVRQDESGRMRKTPPVST